MRRWWIKEGVQVVRAAYQIRLDAVVIDKPESRWRVKHEELAQTSYGTFLKVWGNSLPVAQCRPDLDDPATVGVLIATVRAAYFDRVTIIFGADRWSIETDHWSWDTDNTDSLSEALEAALALSVPVADRWRLNERGRNV